MKSSNRVRSECVRFLLKIKVFKSPLTAKIFLILLSIVSISLSSIIVSSFQFNTAKTNNLAAIYGSKDQSIFTLKYDKTKIHN